MGVNLTLLSHKEYPQVISYCGNDRCTLTHIHRIGKQMKRLGHLAAGVAIWTSTTSQFLWKGVVDMSHELIVKSKEFFATEFNQHSSWKTTLTGIS